MYLNVDKKEISVTFQGVFQVDFEGNISILGTS